MQEFPSAITLIQGEGPPINEIIPAYLSMLRGAYRADGRPSMWRGRLGGVGCCGELSEDGERLPPSLANGSCRARRVRASGGRGVSSQSPRSRASTRGFGGGVRWEPHLMPVCGAPWAGSPALLSHPLLASVSPALPGQGPDSNLVFMNRDMRPQGYILMTFSQCSP